jgi:hypothetical protein
MRMIPPEITQGTSSDAERTVFRLLRDSEIGGQARCFHSLNISEHDHKLVGEIDFLILAPQGVLVLEVKGGGVAREDGIWRFTDRWGREHRTSEGPFQQARSAMFSLRRRLREDLNRAVTRGTVFGYAVITPDSDLPDDSAEWSSEMVLDRPKLAGATEIGDLIKRAFGILGGQDHGRDCG